MVPISEHLQGILDNLPTKPGCYLMKNAQGRIIYVGKAINLRNRVRSYFTAARTTTARPARWSGASRTLTPLWSAPSWKP